MSPLLAAICAIWIGVWEGPPYLSVISVGGSMNVRSGHRLVLHDFIVVTYLTCHILTIFANHLLFAFNVVCRTPIRHVSFSNGWTRTHAHVYITTMTCTNLCCLKFIKSFKDISKSRRHKYSTKVCSARTKNHCEQTV